MSAVLAVEGCCHGELERIYASVARMEAESGVKVELLINCGDFQCMRNRVDLQGFSAPTKYHSMGSFHKYYSGELIAPVLTLFVGGNHEASSFLQELPYGGWVAPNIYFLGNAGVVRFKGLRIAGTSGIFDARHWSLGHYERPPYNPDTLRSVYHTRSLDAFRLQCLRCPETGPVVDIFLSHDWPAGISMFGDVEGLLRRKAFLTSEVYSGTLGSPPDRTLLQMLRPRYWFAAHLHVKFAAVVVHGDRHPRRKSEEVPSGDVGQQQVSEDGAQKTRTMVESAPDVTKFLSLDKCLRKRDFLQLVTISPYRLGEQQSGVDVEVKVPSNDSQAAEAGTSDSTATADTTSGLCYDLEWLSVLKKTWLLETGVRDQIQLPEVGTVQVSDEDMEEIRGQLVAQLGVGVGGETPAGDIRIPENFRRTAPTEGESSPCKPRRGMLSLLPNPQTDFLLNALKLQHIITVPCQVESSETSKPSGPTGTASHENSTNDDSIGIGRVDFCPDVVDEDENEIDI